MRQVLINTLLVLCVILMLGLVFRVLSPVVIYIAGDHEHSYSYDNQHQDWWVQRLADPSTWAAIATACFTFGLYWVSKGQKALLIQANVTAANALQEAMKASNEAKRSTDSYIEGERGRMAIVEVVAMANSATDMVELDYRLSNLGRTPVLVEQLAWVVTMRANTDDLIPSSFDGAFLQIPGFHVLPSKDLSGRETVDVNTRFGLVPTGLHYSEIIRDHETRFIVAECAVRYQTPFGQRYQYRFTARLNVTAGTFQLLYGRGHTGEILL